MIHNFIIKILSIFLQLIGKKRLSEIVPRYSIKKEILPELMSFICARLGLSKAPVPISVTIEPTNHCNLKCSQCPLHTMTRKEGMLEQQTLSNILSNKSIRRVCLTVWGEPLLHKKLEDIVKKLHQLNIYVMLFSNATALTKIRIKNLIASGLNSICFSLDGIEKTYEKVRGWNYEDVENKINNFLVLNNEKGNPVRTEINMVDFDETKNEKENLLNKWSDKVDLISISPLMTTQKLRTKRCELLWRTCVIYWDGSVVPCCVDINKTLELGNINNSSLKDIFNGQKMRDLRKSHVKKEYPDVCKYCNDYYS